MTGVQTCALPIFGQAAMVQGGKVTQVMPVDARSVDKQPPVQPEVDAGAGDR